MRRAGPRSWGMARLSVWAGAVVGGVAGHWRAPSRSPVGHGREAVGSEVSSPGTLDHWVVGIPPGFWLPPNLGGIPGVLLESGWFRREPA